MKKELLGGIGNLVWLKKLDQAKSKGTAAFIVKRVFSKVYPDKQSFFPNNQQPKATWKMSS